MSDYDNIYKKLRQEFSDEEIAEGYMIPASLTEQELQESNQELLSWRMDRLANRTEKQRLLSELARLRITISRYLKNDSFHEAYSFGKILNQYIAIIGKNKKEFSKDIDLHPSKLSRLINEKEEPNNSLCYRLEKHSDEIIPALLWWKLMMRKQAFLIEKNTSQRKKEAARVQNSLKLTA